MNNFRFMAKIDNLAYQLKRFNDLTEGKTPTLDEIKQRNKQLIEYCGYRQMKVMSDDKLRSYVK